MGPGFPSRLANLFMSNEKYEGIFEKKWEGLRTWKRFIHDILIVWDGSMEFLLKVLFLEMIIMHTELRFPKLLITKMINFLDLNVFVSEGTIMDISQSLVDTILGGWKISLRENSLG